MAGHDKITADGKAFFKQIAELKKLQVRVGFQRGQEVKPKPYEKDVDIADIAMWNELGTANSPSRPFIRESADRNKGEIEKFCKAQLQTIAKGKTAEKMLNAVGVMQKGLIKDTISKSKDWAESNAKRTVKKKGSDTPLVDTSRMLQSVSYAIVPKGGDS